MRRTFEELFGVRNLSQEVAEKIISEVELGEAGTRTEIMHRSFVIPNEDLHLSADDRYVKYLVPAIKGVAGLLNKYPRVIVKSLCISEALAHKCGYDHYLHEGDVIPVGIKVSYLHEG